MSRTARLWVLAVGLAGVGVCLALAFVRLPSFGSSDHPYRDAAVPAAVQHVTANVVSAINFDQRGADTLGEESILLGSVIGVAVLLRLVSNEDERRPSEAGRVLEPTRLLGYVMLPTTLVLGLDLILHGQVTPGGGFQGGITLGTGIHLLYVAGTYRALERLRPVHLFEYGEAIGAGAFAVLGIAGTVTAAAFLANVLPLGSMGAVFSAGTVPLLNGAVGLEVASGVVVLLAKFLEQALVIEVDA